MAQINLGRIGIVPKGEWNNIFTYNRLDLVAYAGGGYVSLVDDNNNKLPTDTAYWLQISERGKTGNIDNLEDWHISDALGYTPANKAVVDAHKAQNVSQLITAERDLTLAGVQEITGLLGVPKRIEIVASIVDWVSLMHSIGAYEVNGHKQNCYAIFKSASGNPLSYKSGQSIIQAFKDENNYLSGYIQNVTANKFEILWVNHDTSPTGTVSLTIRVYYH